MASATSHTPEPTSGPPASGPYIGVTLIDSGHRQPNGTGTPIPDAKLTVSTPDKKKVGEGVTGKDGRAFIPLPSRGTYTITLDTSTLPRGVSLGKGGASRTITALLDSGNFAQFQIGVKAVKQVSFGQQLLENSISGLKFGLIIALAALGLSLVFGTTGLTNFAHGELVTLGMLLTYLFNVVIGLPVIAAAVIAVVLGGVFGWLQDRVLWRPLRHRGTGLIAMMIVSIGLGLLMRNVYQYLFGGNTKSFSKYTTQSRHDYGFISLAPKEIAIIGVATAAIVIVCVALMKTRQGKAMRAVADNPALAASSGLRVDGVISLVWILGTALSCLAGVLLGINSQVNFLSGTKMLLLVFAAVTLGGLGTIWGALLGSLVIGLMTEVGPLFGVPASIKEVGALVVLIVILLVRPQGILGRKERIG